MTFQTGNVTSDLSINHRQFHIPVYGSGGGNRKSVLEIKDRCDAHGGSLKRDRNFRESAKKSIAKEYVFIFQETNLATPHTL